MSVSKIWAIDIGNSTIKGAFLRKARHGIEILDAGIIKLSPPVLSQTNKDPSRDSRIWKGIAEFENRYHISRYPVTVAIPPVNTLIHEIDIAIVGKRTLEELVRYEASNTIPYVLDEVFWDYHMFPQATSEGGRLNGLLFAVKKSAIHTYITAFSKAGVDKIAEIILTPMGLLSFLKYDESIDPTSCLGVDIGARNCIMVGVYDDEFWLRDFAYGGDDITKILTEKFEIPFKQAEESKHKIKESPMAEALFEIIKPGIQQLAREMKTQLEYVERTGNSSDFENVFLCGGGRRLPGVKQKFGQITGRPPHIISKTHGFSVKKGVDRKFLTSNLDRFAVALGAGIKALGGTSFTFSLAPETTARSVKRAGKKNWGTLLAAAALFLALALTFFFRTVDARIREVLEPAQDVVYLFADRQRELEDAADVDAITAGIYRLSEIPRGRAQVAEIVSAITSSFAHANQYETEEEEEDVQVSFRLEELKTVPEVIQSGEAGGQELHVFSTHISGVISNGNLSPSRAYSEFDTRLLSQLRKSKTLALAVSQAEFKSAEQRVTLSGDSLIWQELIQQGDRVYVFETDSLYSFGKFRGDSAFTLNEPFQSEDDEQLESEFAITRVRILSWDHEKMAFEIEIITPILQD